MLASLWLLSSLAHAGPDCPGLAGKALVGEPGKRKIALLVGVGDYLATIGGKSIDLEGPPNDVKRMRDVLENGYGFPSDNVCVLTDSQATRANLDSAWTKHLERAAPGDTVVYYFSGHGSQTTDFDGPKDETDGFDETVLLHDSRTPKGGSELIDDQFNAMLAQLYTKTENVTVIVDACHSGTTTRGDAAVQRAVEPIARSAPSGGAKPPAGSDYVPGRFDNLVFLSAARDGTVALERNGQGVFTNALLHALEYGPNRSWTEIANLVPRSVAAQRSFQIPSFEGQLDRQAFGTSIVGRPLSWPVVGVQGDIVQFRGPSLPGWSTGAVVDVVAADGQQVKATVTLTQVEPMRAEGKLRAPAAAPVSASGDYGRLLTPGPDAFAIEVRFAAGVPMLADIQRNLTDNEVLKRTVRVVTGPADFEVRPGSSAGTVEIWGAEGVRRNRLSAKSPEDGADIAWALGLHARQASLLGLTNEVTTTYAQGSVLTLRVLPSPAQDGCAREPYVAPTGAVPYVEVPMCNAVQLDVELAVEPQQPLNIGILYLANDGTIAVYPQGNTTEVLRHKGEHFTMPLGWVAPPVDSPDRIVAFGTHEQVNWAQLQAKAPPPATRGAGLSAFVGSQVSGTRGAKGTEREEEAAAKASGWTSSFLQLQVVGGSKWSSAEQADPGICAARRKALAEKKTCPK